MNPFRKTVTLVSITRTLTETESVNIKQILHHLEQADVEDFSEQIDKIREMVSAYNRSN